MNNEICPLSPRGEQVQSRSSLHINKHQLLWSQEVPPYWQGNIFLVYESGDPWELNNLRNKASFFILFFQFFFCSQVLMFVNIILLFIVR